MVSDRLFDGGEIEWSLHPKRQRTIADRHSAARFDERCGAERASMVTTTPAMPR